MKNIDELEIAILAQIATHKLNSPLNLHQIVNGSNFPRKDVDLESLENAIKNLELHSLIDKKENQKYIITRKGKKYIDSILKNPNDAFYLNVCTYFPQLELRKKIIIIEYLLISIISGTLAIYYLTHPAIPNTSIYFGYYILLVFLIASFFYTVAFFNMLFITGDLVYDLSEKISFEWLQKIYPIINKHKKIVFSLIYFSANILGYFLVNWYLPDQVNSYYLSLILQAIALIIRMAYEWFKYGKINIIGILGE